MRSLVLWWEDRFQCSLWGWGVFMCCNYLFLSLIEFSMLHQVRIGGLHLRKPQLCSYFNSTLQWGVTCSELRQPVICTSLFVLICTDTDFNAASSIPHLCLATLQQWLQPATQQHLFSARLHFCFPENALLWKKDDMWGSKEGILSTKMAPVYTQWWPFGATW